MALLRKTCVLGDRCFATVPASDFVAKNSPPDCFLTQLTLLGFKSCTYQKQKRTELEVLSVSVVGVAGFEQLKARSEC